MGLAIWAEAASSGGQLAALLAIAGLIGSAATWGVAKLSSWLDQRRAHNLQDEQTQIDRLEALLSRIDAERKELRSEVNALRERLTRNEINLAHAVTWIKSAQYVMKKKNIDHPPWHDPQVSDTAVQRALQQEDGDHGRTDFTS